MESFSLFLFYSTLQPTREQHPTSTMTCDTSRSDDDDNNTTTTPSHVDTATRPGSLRVLFLGRTKLPSCVPCARETTPSVKPCRATLDSGKPRASSATHKQQATRPVHSVPLSSHFGHTRELFSSAPVDKRSSASARVHGYRRFCHALVALQSSLCDRCSQRVDIDAARLKPIEPLKNEP